MKRFSLLFLFVSLACSPATPPAVTPPQLAAAGVAQRVVLMSFDGLGADLLQTKNSLANFARVANASARVIPVNPTVTGSAHVSILTGADPQKHGIVANRFHVAGTPVEKTTMGMETDPDVETIVEAARRQGKRVGAVPFSTIDAKTPRRTADFGMTWTESLTKPRTIVLTRADFHREWVPPTWTSQATRRPSFSPIMRARVEWNLAKRARADIDFVAYDTTNDGVENYDALFVEDAEHELTADAQGWFPIARQTSEGLAGSWSKVLAADAALQRVAIYWGAISRTNAYPESYGAMLDAAAGFWPGVPDADAGATIYREQTERLADFLTRVQTLTIERVPFDLLLAYHPEIDEASHHYLGRDEAVIDSAFTVADHAVGAIMSKLDPARDALVVTGDHGLMPVDTEVHLNRWLADQGFAPRWRAYASANVAQFYRFSGSDDSDALVNYLTSSGRFEQVTKKTPAMHRNSGDVVGIAYPNVLLSASSDAPAVVKPASQAASHGALNTHRELHTVLFAWGAGVPRGDFGTIAQTKIARFVTSLLGIAPPAGAE
jgi:predicted AlkP superfamily pyrophosphatase or phosphodiesterase